MDLSYKFKPPKVDKKEKDREIWTTEKVDKVFNSMIEGYKPKSSPFWDGDPRWRKADIIFEYTDTEIEEIKKCKNDIIYFANTYCHVMTDDGVQKIELRDYQEDMLKAYQDNRFVITLASRQIGKTIVTAIFNAWYLCVHFDRNVLFLSNKGDTTVEIIDKTKVIFENLPFFIKPGVSKNDVHQIRFDNGCRLIGQNTNKKAGIGFTIHVLYLDEFAHISHTFLNTFYENAYPTLSSSKVSRILITSTPNGQNKFYDIYKAATEGKNEFYPVKIDWWMVPGRDDVWKAREIANLGSEEAFNEQYGNQFFSSGKLLFGQEEMKKLDKAKVEYVTRSFIELEDIELDYHNLQWHPDFDVETLTNKEHFFICSIDVAEGVGQDYTVLNIFEVDVIEPRLFRHIVEPSDIYDFFCMKQVGVLRHNRYTTNQFAKIAYTLIYEIMNFDNVRVVLEWNAFGHDFKTQMETVFQYRNKFDENIFVKYEHTLDAKTKKIGIRLRRDNKKVACNNLRLAVHQNKLSMSEIHTVEEAATFGLIGNSYAAQSGHDDLVMSSVNGCTFLDTIHFNNFVEELYDFIPDETQKYIDKYINKAVEVVEDDEGDYDFTIDDDFTLASQGIEGDPLFIKEEEEDIDFLL